MELLKWGEEPRQREEVRLRLARHPDGSIEVQMVDDDGNRIPKGSICRFYEDDWGRLSMELAPWPTGRFVSIVNNHIRVTRQKTGRDDSSPVLI